MNVDHTKELKHISLCTGYGGIDIGLSRALRDVRTVAYVEIEAFVIENLVSKIENNLLDVAPIFTDLKTFPWELFNDRVDILSGGFPCQPFSGAGRRTGDEDPRHLWPYIVRGIRELGRPTIVFFENVEGIIGSKLKSNEWSDPEGTPVLLHVLRELERLGYDATAGVFSAREIGAPHQRKRVFIMGVRSDLSESGRNIVSSMLRDTESRGSVLEHTTSTRPQGSRSGKRSARVFTIPTKSSTNTAYPAPRGAEPYQWEPPRVTMGDTKHARSPCAEKQKGSDAASDNCSQRTNSPFKLERASQSRSGGDISSCSTGAPRDNDVVDTDNTRLQRQAILRLQGEEIWSSTTRSGTRGNIHRETQSALGGDVDGFADWMDYAELSKSVDNHTDELRLLGNGVVPDTAQRAFRELWRDLNT